MSLLAHQRTRSATELIDASIQFFRGHAVPLLTIAAIVTIPPAIITALVPKAFETITGFLGNLLSSVGGAAVTLYVVAVMQEGEISVGEAFHRVKAGSVIAAQILYGLAVIFGTLLLVIPGIVFLIRYSLATTVAAVEGTNSSQSVKRSWALTKGHSMHVLGTLALGFFLAMIVLFGGAFVLGLLAGAVGLDDSATDLLVTPMLVLVAPFVWVLVTLLYLDVRMRVEGADIQAMVAELPGAPTGAPVA
jgi:hypothetical protein